MANLIPLGTPSRAQVSPPQVSIGFAPAGSRPPPSQWGGFRTPQNHKFFSGDLPQGSNFLFIFRQLIKKNAQKDTIFEFFELPKFFCCFKPENLLDRVREGIPLPRSFGKCYPGLPPKGTPPGSRIPGHLAGIEGCAVLCCAVRV